MAMLMALIGGGLAGCSHNCYDRGEGCVSSGGGGGGGGTVTLAAKGKITDGYVANATVTLDTNDDRICAASEPHVQANAAGDFTFPSSLGQHMVCASGGTDLSTGLPLVGQLIAPAGSTQITPLTNLVMAGYNSAHPPVLGSPSALSAADATAATNTLATKLGLSGVDLLNADPVALAASNPALLQTTAAIQSLMVQTAKLLASAGGGSASDTSALMADALAAVNQSLAALPSSGAGSTLSTATLGTIASSVVSNATTNAKADPALSGLAALATLSPTSMATFAGPALASMTDAVSTASTSSMLTPGASNPSAAVQSSVTVSNTAGALASFLTTAAATSMGANAATDLASLSSAALPVPTSPGIPAVDANTASAAVTSANSIATSAGVTVPATLTATLTAAASLSDVVTLSALSVNCSTTCVAATQQTDKPVAEVVNVTGALNDVTITLGSVNGTAVTSGSAGAVITITPTDVTNPEFLSLTLSALQLSQTTGQAPLFVTGTVPNSASLVAKGIKTNGGTTSATLTGTIVNSQGILAIDNNAHTVTISVKKLLAALPTVSGGFPVLTTFNGTSTTGKSYLITTTFPGVQLKSLSTNPVVTNSFTTQVNFQ